MLGRRVAQLLPYAEVGTIVLNERQFALRVRGSEQSVVSLPLSTPNILPGALALIALFSAGN